jgi:hypothetical protein
MDPPPSELPLANQEAKGMRRGMRPLALEGIDEPTVQLSLRVVKDGPPMVNDGLVGAERKRSSA